MRDGRPIESADEQVRELEERALRLQQGKLPIYQALGIVH